MQNAYMESKTLCDSEYNPLLLLSGLFFYQSLIFKLWSPLFIPAYVYLSFMFSAIHAWFML